MLLCLYSVDMYILFWHNISVVMRRASQLGKVFLISPKMMSDLMQLRHTDVPPVILALTFRMKFLKMDTQMARSYSPHRHNVLIQICHKIFILHKTLDQDLTMTSSWNSQKHLNLCANNCASF